MTRQRAVTIVGIGNDGCHSLTSRAMGAIARADVLVGGARQLAFFAEFSGERVILQNGIAPALELIERRAAEQHVCVLASGDPLFFGIASLVIRKLGAEHVQVLPQPSSVQWAFAHIGLKWDDATVLSLHGRGRAGLLTRLKRLSKVAILTDGDNSPSRIAADLMEHGDTGWQAWVCEDLGAPDERVRTCSIGDLSLLDDISPLNVLILVRCDPSWKEPRVVPFLHEDEFAKRMPRNGLITKREVRLLSLASLGLRPHSVMWDVGAGSGSIAIEAALLAPYGRTYAIEVDNEGVDICRENARTHGVDNVFVVAGRAPQALLDLESPDAVFIGGSNGGLDSIIEVALDRLNPGGRIVVNAITLENAGEAYGAFRRRNLIPEVTLLQVSRARPLANYLRYEALNPVQIFAVEKPVGER